MSKISSDLESLVTFRDHLGTFNRTLQDDFGSMRTHWQNLGDVWSDAKYQEFGEALEDVSRGIERYLAVTDEHEVHLVRLIETLNAYLDSSL